MTMNTEMVTMALPVNPLRGLQRCWESGDNFGTLELTFLLRDLFDDQDGHLARIDEAIGCIQPEAQQATFTEDQVNALVSQAHQDGFVAGLAGAKMRDKASISATLPPFLERK